jgi:hypothetical protein
LPNLLATAQKNLKIAHWRLGAVFGGAKPGSWVFLNLFRRKDYLDS